MGMCNWTCGCSKRRKLKASHSFCVQHRCVENEEIANASKYAFQGNSKNESLHFLFPQLQFFAALQKNSTWKKYLGTSITVRTL